MSGPVYLAVNAAVKRWPGPPLAFVLLLPYFYLPLPAEGQPNNSAALFVLCLDQTLLRLLRTGASLILACTDQLFLDTG